MKLNNKGFTLVELLAVIVVLALLMVVATRTIGNTLTDSRREAMNTEAKKIVSKTYEDLETANLMVKTLADDKYTYKNVATSTGAKDGDYTIKITVSGAPGTYKMTDVCVSDGSFKSVGTIAGATITFTSEYVTGTC